MDKLTLIQVITFFVWGSIVGFCTDDDDVHYLTRIKHSMPLILLGVAVIDIIFYLMRTQ